MYDVKDNIVTMTQTQVVWGRELLNHISGRIEITSVRDTVDFVIYLLRETKPAVETWRRLVKQQATKNANTDNNFVATNVYRIA
jgi:hypothetical protein